jgi:hypothetical protein
LELANKFELDIKKIKNEVYRLAWYMRGGVSAHDLLWNLTTDDREVISNIISENIKTTNETGLPLV